MLLIAWGAAYGRTIFKQKDGKLKHVLSELDQCGPLLYREKLHDSPGQSTTTTPAVITTTMLKNTGFFPAGLLRQTARGSGYRHMWFERPKPGITTGNGCIQWWHTLPVKALIQMAKDITTGLGGYIRTAKQPQVHYVPGQ